MHQAFICTLYQIGAIQFGEFKLKSGEQTSIYINLRKIISHPALLRDTAHLMWESIKDCHFDLICGVPYAALPIATCISLEHNVPMIMRRKEKKDYGTKQMIEGDFQPGQCALIIEDVITSGSSILETTEGLEAEGLIVKDVAALICRENQGIKNLSQKYHPHVVFDLFTILDTLTTSSLLTNKEKMLLEKFRENKTE